MSKWNIKNRDVFISPTEAFKDLKNIYGIDLKNAYDPCPYPESEIDGLTVDWKSPAYVNPPFSKALLWVKKAIEESKKGVDVYMMLPYYCWHDRTTTNWGNSAVTKHIKNYECTKRYRYIFKSPFEDQKHTIMDIRYLKIPKCI